MSSVRVVLDQADISRAVRRLAHEIVENSRGSDDLIILGIPTRGVPLARRIAETFAHELLLEEAELNPFLERFYQNRQQTALATQLFFLFQRVQKITELKQRDMFDQNRVADFVLEKDRFQYLPEYC